MELVSDSVGNTTALLIERIFWLGIGVFLGLAILTSLLRGLKEGKSKTKAVKQKELEELARKATQKK